MSLADKIAGRSFRLLEYSEHLNLRQLYTCTREFGFSHYSADGGLVHAQSPSALDSVISDLVKFPEKTPKISGIFHYFGTYSVEGDVLIHHVRGGTAVPADFHFRAGLGRFLELKEDRGAGHYFCSVWERI